MPWQSLLVCVWSRKARIHTKYTANTATRLITQYSFHNNMTILLPYLSKHLSTPYHSKKLCWEPTPSCMLSRHACNTSSLTNMHACMCAYSRQGSLTSCCVSLAMWPRQETSPQPLTRTAAGAGRAQTDNGAHQPLCHRSTISMWEGGVSCTAFGWQWQHRHGCIKLS